MSLLHEFTHLPTTGSVAHSDAGIPAPSRSRVAVPLIGCIKQKYSGLSRRIPSTYRSGGGEFGWCKMIWRGGARHIIGFLGSVLKSPPNVPRQAGSPLPCLKDRYSCRGESHTSSSTGFPLGSRRWATTSHWTKTTTPLIHAHHHIHSSTSLSCFGMALTLQSGREAGRSG
jgi:hypothetical protein